MLETIEPVLEKADIAQQAWSTELLKRRTQKISPLSAVIAARYQELVDAIQRPEASAAEKLSSEILPLADACRFNCSNARSILAPRRMGFWNGAWWLGRVGVHTVREPWGTILILAPSNYPLFLPGVQALQALVAGNAVVVKPAPGHTQVMECLHSCLCEAGVPPDLFQILPEDNAAATEVIRSGVDKVVLTGSLATGRAVLRELAETVTPSAMELSGCDAVFILPQADVQLAAKAICYALQLNAGRTCIAPRRILVTPENALAFQAALVEQLASEKLASEQMAYASRRTRLPTTVAALVQRVVQDATAGGASILYGSLPTEPDAGFGPLILTDVTPEMKIARTDIFAPVASIIPVDSVEEAVIANRKCPYSLGASIFGPTNYASYVADQISAGCVVINDLVAPTADPRVAFGGHNQSGWGVTRGAEGLLEMTRPKVICTRRGKWLPHLDKQMSQNDEALVSLLQLFHAQGWRARWNALVQISQQGRKASGE